MEPVGWFSVGVGFTSHTSLSQCSDFHPTLQRDRVKIQGLGSSQQWWPPRKEAFSCHPLVSLSRYHLPQNSPKPPCGWLIKSRLITLAFRTHSGWPLPPFPSSPSIANLHMLCAPVILIFLLAPQEACYFPTSMQYPSQASAPAKSPHPSRPSTKAIKPSLLCLPTLKLASIVEDFAFPTLMVFISYCLSFFF